MPTVEEHSQGGGGKTALTHRPSNSSPLAALHLATACIHNIHAFRSLQAEWEDLYCRCPGVTPFNSWEWLFSWWQAYGNGGNLRLVTWRSHEVLVGLMPLYLASERITFGRGCRVLRVIGDGSSDSDYLGWLVCPEVVDRVAEAFGAWLRESREWDVLVLRDLPEPSVLPGLLRTQSLASGFLFRSDSGRCGALDLPTSMEEFLRSRQPRFRTKLRSLLKRIEQNGLTVETECEPAHLRRRLRSLFALHQERWRHAGQVGVFANMTKRLFYAHFVPRFARKGWLRLYSLRQGNQYLAHQLCFSEHGVTYLLQEAFDVSQSAASNGQTLRAAVIKKLIEGGERRYDFLGGFSRHKEGWGATEASTVHVVVARRNWRGLVYVQAPLWREQLAVTATRILPGVVVERLKRMWHVGKKQRIFTEGHLEARHDSSN